MSSAINSSSPSTRNQSPSTLGRNPEDLITYCCICFLPVSNGLGNTSGIDPKFWLTSCGHIVCGSHCFPNGVPQDAAERTHICPYCGSGGISLADLGAGKVSVELRDYFRPEAELLEDVTGAIKFRMSNALRIASHYRALSEKLQIKVEDQRRVLLKVKDELIEGKELKKNKSIMEAEIASLREEVSRLRSQFPSAQSPSLDYDVQQSAQQQRYQSESTIPQQNSASPITTTQGNPNILKRKADDVGSDPAFRAREFRDEMNKRQAQMQAMPPPPAPQRGKQQYQDNRQENQYFESMKEQNQEQKSEFSSKLQQLGYSPQARPQQIYGDQSPFRSNTSPQHNIQHHGISERQRFPINRRGQFVDLTEPPGHMGPQQSPQSGFTSKHQSSDRVRNDNAVNINNPFQSPLRVSTPRPINTLPIRGSRDRYFTSPINQSPRSGVGYANNNNLSPLLQNKTAAFHSPKNRDDNFSSRTRQEESAAHPYGRVGQSKVPSTPKITNKEGGSVVSPFFVEPGTSAIPGSRGPNIRNFVQRPASVSSFIGQQQGSLNRSYGAGLGETGFFSRHPLSGEVDTVKSPNWGTPRLGTKLGSFQGGGEIRPGTDQGLGRIGGNVFNSQRGVGIADRPGLRRTVRRD